MDRKDIQGLSFVSLDEAKKMKCISLSMPGIALKCIGSDCIKWEPVQKGLNNGKVILGGRCALGIVSGG